MTLETDFAKIQADHVLLIADAWAKVTNEDSAYWIGLANKEIRAPLRVWLANVLLFAPPSILPAYLAGLPSHWQNQTDKLLEKPDAALVAAKKATTLRRDGAPPVLTLEHAASDYRWRAWLRDYEAGTGLGVEAPYKQETRLGWGVVAGALAVATGLAVSIWRGWR